MIILKRIFFFITILVFSNSYSIDVFVFERPCPLYEIEGESYKKIGKLEEKKRYKFKNFKQIKKKNYAVIEDENQKEFHVNKNCGYQKFEEKPKLEKIFNDDEIKKLDLMSEFDKEIINFCGYLGSHPTREKFIEIISSEKYRVDFEYIYERLNKKIFDSSIKGESREEFLLNLVNILFKTGGFIHSTCGFVRGEKLAGPHYYYRFLDLQKNGFIGKNNIKNCGNKNLNDRSMIKNLDLSFFDSSKNFHVKCNNSFVQDLEIRDLIVVMGQIGKISNTNFNHEELKSDRARSFIYKMIFKDQDVSFKIVYNETKKSLITIYPIR